MQASREPMTMLKQNKSTILTDKNSLPKKKGTRVSLTIPGRGKRGHGIRDRFPGITRFLCSFPNFLSG